MKRIFIFPTIAEAKAFILTEPRDAVFVAGVGMAEIAAATVRAVKAKKPQLVVLAGIAGAYDRTLQRGEVVEVITERVAGLPERFAREYEASGPDLGLPLAGGVTVNRSGEGLQEGAQEGAQEVPAGATAEVLQQVGAGAENEQVLQPVGAGAGAELVLQPGGTGAGADQAPAPVTPGFIPTDEAADLATAGGPSYDVPTAEPAADELSAKGQSACVDSTGTEDALPEVENMEGAALFAVCEALGVACCQVRAISNYVGEPFEEWAVDEAVENLTAKLTQIFGNDE